MKTEQEQKGAGRARNNGENRVEQNGTSIYFLLWAAFCLIALVIIISFSFVSYSVTAQTYKSEAARQLSEKGNALKTVAMQEVPPEFNGDRSEYFWYLSSTNDVKIYILEPDGDVLFPRHFQGGDTASKYINSRQIQRIEQELSGGLTHVVYEGVGEYIYATKVPIYNASAEGYFCVTKSLKLVESAMEQISIRSVFVSIFIFVLVFALASAVSGWLVKPISEMTKKARLLAHGDFNVDFHGRNYGTEMAQLAETLNFARDELSKTDRMQKELIANVSHDFKTPLTMIKGYASMIREISGDVPEKRNRHAQVIEDEADRLASLVTDLLDLSKIRSGLQELKTSVVDMSAYTQEILERFDFLKETQGYIFHADVEENLFAKVDELTIGQVLYNLIGNAVNYTGEDKTVYVSLKRVKDDTFRFSVRDTGKGIEKEELATIWDRYYRSSEAHKRPVRGTGLGLSIVKAVLDRHELKYGVESEKGKGSEFYVDFVLES